MKNLPAKTNRSQLTSTDMQVERIDQPVSVSPTVSPFTGPFFNFTYSRQEMRISADGKTHIKQKKVQLENGRIESEAFEGYAPAAVFEQTMKDTQRQFADQANWFLKQFSLFPLFTRIRSDDDLK